MPSVKITILWINELTPRTKVTDKLVVLKMVKKSTHFTKCEVSALCTKATYIQSIAFHPISSAYILIKPISVATRSKARVYDRSVAVTVGSNPAGVHECLCWVLSGRGLCDGLITRPEESYRPWCVVVCDLETSRTRRPCPALGRSATGGRINKNSHVFPGLSSKVYSKKKSTRIPVHSHDFNMPRSSHIPQLYYR